MKQYVLVGLVLVSLATGCGDDASVCGDGVMAREETCDDGNAFGGDGCSSLCAREIGWLCETETTCEPVCLDGRTVESEVCDPSDSRFTQYCAADCMSTIASCGDGDLQPAHETCDDGNATPADGCTSTCTAALGFTCTAAGVCDASDVPPATTLGALAGQDLTRFCTWLSASLGGAGRSYNCGGTTFEVNSVSECQTAVLGLSGPIAACTVGDYEAYVAESGDACTTFTSTRPLC